MQWYCIWKTKTETSPAIRSFFPVETAGPVLKATISGMQRTCGSMSAFQLNDIQWMFILDAPGSSQLLNDTHRTAHWLCWGRFCGTLAANPRNSRFAHLLRGMRRSSEGSGTKMHNESIRNCRALYGIVQQYHLSTLQPVTGDQLHHRYIAEIAAW